MVKKETRMEITTKLFEGRRSTTAKATKRGEIIDRAVTLYLDTVVAVCVEIGFDARNSGKLTTYTVEEETLRKLETAVSETGISRSQLVRAVLHCLAINMKPKKPRLWWQCDRCSDRVRLADKGSGVLRKPCKRCKGGYYQISLTQ